MSLPPNLYVGTYARNGGEGLYPIIAGNGLSLGGPFRGAPNCSFAAFDPSRALAYCVDEQEQGFLRVCRVGTDSWEVLAEHPTGGSAPCYVSLDRNRTRLAVANYESGSVALFALDRDSGLPLGSAQLWSSSGSGPVADRQEGPHMHCAIFVEDVLYAVDLGTDRIFGFDLSDEKPLADPFVAFAAPAGSGPRHLVLHPHLPVAYLVSELASTIAVLDRAGPKFTARSTMRLAPQDYEGDNLGGHLALNAAATHLYASARGHDSIAVFEIAPDGGLTLVQHVASQGASPRCFVLLEADGACLVANEEGQSLALLPIAPDGTLREASDVLAVAGAAFPFSAGAAG